MRLSFASSSFASTLFATTVFATTLFVAGEARAYYPNRIPNYGVYGCRNCHTGTNNGSNDCTGCADSASNPYCLSSFGKQFQANGDVWNATLANQDADGDGFSNGRELLDRFGTWVYGNANPGNSTYVTNPIVANNNMNECALGWSNCAYGSSYCTDQTGTNPGFSCSCPSGYSGSGNPAGQYCNDIDECANNPCGANTTCSNSPGSYSCGCQGGYTYTNIPWCFYWNGSCVWIDNWQCIDNDECASNPCDPHATCTNTPGSYSCACNTDWSGNGWSCTLTNACHYYNACDALATCTNGNGGSTYTCACNSGYQGSGTMCTDIDDCGSNNGSCAANSHCVNQIGVPHTCECDDGYGRDPNDPSSNCIANCGDGSRIPSEQCDDANAVNGDGCSSSCRIEPGWACHERQYYGQSACTKTCGDGVIDPPAEQCDDGADHNSDTAPDACRTTCKRARCGDGVVDQGESCDLGMANSASTPDGCRLECEPAFCGDGVIDPARGETCDNGYGQPLTDDYCNTTKGCRRAVPRPVADGGVDGGGTTRKASGCSTHGTNANAPLAVLLLLAAIVRRRRFGTRR